MTEHIMHSDVVKFMNENNKDKAIQMADSIRAAVKGITDEYEKAEKGDEVAIVFIYTRKWNDILTSWFDDQIVSTSALTSDYLMLQYDVRNYIDNTFIDRNDEEEE